MKDVKDRGRRSAEREGIFRLRGVKCTEEDETACRCEETELNRRTIHVFRKDKRQRYTLAIQYKTRQKSDRPKEVVSQSEKPIISFPPSARPH